MRRRKLEGGATPSRPAPARAPRVPPDLARELASRGAAERFAGFPPASRRAIIAWIAEARRPGTRARRIAETARLAAMNIRVPLWPKM
jgi:uncharacterized protein YdeI (YjbR/CyaY-like superfamily)